ncbi:MAG: excinuclease ABC subunit UvrC [Treponema sp.]|nr:excinuclease ABC subunit UvrC [Treponema sp.]MCL2250692.1 excinuclease ABC subunit UvrC [Treponema sp.]
MESQINSENNRAKLKAAIADAPSEPGVYIMKAEDESIIYVGKAKSLKNRLRSYFSGEKDIKTSTLIRHVHSIETIIAANEYDALLLENTLIKQHSPKYNINLKDGKTYPVIRITNEDFPRIFKTRRIIQDKSIYFGPFPNTGAVDAMLETIDKLFPLRKCKKIKKNGPCMYYHIQRCLAPCCNKITIDEYSLHVERVKKLLSGDTDALIIDLTAKMHEAARMMQFEGAAQIRDAIKAIENLTGEENAVEDHNPEDRDYIAWAEEGVLTSFTVFSMRGGKMTGRDLFRTRSAADENESLELFITTYYDPVRTPPAKIFFQTREKKIENFALLKNWFKLKFACEPELLNPNEKHHEAIIAMAHLNAQEDLRKRLKERGAGPALDELMNALNLEIRPERIEGFDIAQLDGKHPTASLISFKNGIPDRKNYRYFKLKTVIGIVDDFAAMREVVRRRYSRLIREGKELPDLILVDGGIGQVNAAKGVLDDLGIDCSIAGLAKREEELWLPQAKEPIILSRQSEALKILQHVRDECHRFATGFNRRLRSKDLFFSVLESIEGIGPKRALSIMKVYESLENIAASDLHEMIKKCNISEEAARAVRAVVKLKLEEK